MQLALDLVQILISIVLVLAILVQVRGQGTGLFASGESAFRTRRGLERTLFRFTIAMAVVFVIVSIISARIAG